MRRVVEAVSFLRTLQSVFRNRGYESVEWQLTLDCGHIEIRRPKYIKSARYEQMRRERNIYPAPKRVKCHTCEDK